MTEREEHEAWVTWIKENRYRYINQASMAKALEMSQAQLSRLLSGKRKGLRIWRKIQEELK